MAKGVKILRILSCYVALSLCKLSRASSFESPPSASSEAKSLLQWMQTDRFVQAAPLILAAVCRDGVVMIAAHSSDEEEPLMYYSHDEGSIGDDDEDSREHVTNTFLDLPRNYAGPFRIHTVDAFGTTLLACGWRADCDLLLRRARSLAAAEVQRYGTAASPAVGNMGYINYMTTEIALYMAQCAISDRVRPLSAVGLVVFSIPAEELSSLSSSKRFSKMPLWLVDATGAFPVRAMCIGGGLNVASGEPLAKIIQRRLRKRTDLIDLSVDESLDVLLNMLRTPYNKPADGAGKPAVTGDLLKPGTRLEVAIVGATQKRLERKRVASILTAHSNL